MPQIIVSNTSSIPRAEIITIVSDDHILSENESMQAWLSNGGTIETWSRLTSIVKITDKTLEELNYLLDITDTGENKWYFAEPDPESLFYQTLYIAGEITTTFDEMNPFLRERL